MKMFHRSHIVAFTTKRAKQAHRKDAKTMENLHRLHHASQNCLKKYYDGKTMEISHRLPIACKIRLKFPISQFNDGESMKTLHRFTHHHPHQRHTNTSLRNDVTTMEILHRLHISSKLHVKSQSM